MVKRIVRPTVQLPSEKEEDSVKSKTKSTTPMIQDERDIYTVMEMRDEEQIVATLQGRVSEEFLYEFCRRHKWQNGVRPPECACKDLVVGISWFGIQESSRVYGGIQVPVEKAKARETPDEVEFMVEAIDSQTNSSRIGISSQPKNMTTRQGVFRDAFATQKALSKAQRNAIKQLLPQTMLKEWIQKHRNGGNGKAQAPAPAAAGSSQAHSGSAQHPLDSKALELKEQIVRLTGSDEAYLNTLGLQGAEDLSQLDVKNKAAFVNELLKVVERLKARAA
jgi:hypothetical protein